MLGERLASRPRHHGVVERIKTDKGHEIGVHGFDHKALDNPPVPPPSAPEAKAETAKAYAAVAAGRCCGTKPSPGTPRDLPSASQTSLIPLIRGCHRPASCFKQRRCLRKHELVAPSPIAVTARLRAHLVPLQLCLEASGRASDLRPSPGAIILLHDVAAATSVGQGTKAELLDIVIKAVALQRRANHSSDAERCCSKRRGAIDSPQNAGPLSAKGRGWWQVNPRRSALIGSGSGAVNNRGALIG